VEVAEYARIAAVEDGHWWYRNTRALMADLLGPWLGAGQTILDAGCGPGGNGAWLAAHGTVVAVDLAPEALAFVHERRHALDPVRATVTQLPLASQSIDVATAVTVLYAVDDDAAAARELARVLRPGGALLLVEPALPKLQRAHDRVVGGLRRYRRAGLTAILEGAGLQVRRATYAYSFLVAPAALLALADRARPRPPRSAGSDVDRRALDPVFGRLAAAERTHIARGGRVPFGTSVIVVATRRDRRAG